jgi:hypothetical protein
MNITFRGKKNLQYFFMFQRLLRQQAARIGGLAPVAAFRRPLQAAQLGTEAGESITDLMEKGPAGSGLSFVFVLLAGRSIKEEEKYNILAHFLVLFCRWFQSSQQVNVIFYKTSLSAGSKAADRSVGCFGTSRQKKD